MHRVAQAPRIEIRGDAGQQPPHLLARQRMNARRYALVCPVLLRQIGREWRLETAG
ncbi:hypothetical protein Ntsu_58070 [Nocardia sp. IFM 10818]